MEAKPIPALYVCYLLRSTKRASSLYVGSTPNPRRRLTQHNGDATGGAVRTARKNLQPWEMGLIVLGFPSSIAALQFEWAWQNTHLTRHITEEKRITRRETTKRSPKAGRTRRRPARPYMSLINRLANLHLLLHAPSFVRWPLEVRFLCEDIYHSWQKCTSTLENNTHRDIRISLDLAQSKHQPIEGSSMSSVTRRKLEKRKPALRQRGIEDLNVSYTFLKSHLEKSLFLLAEGKRTSCAMCAETIQSSATTTLVCPHDGCESTSHLRCLAKRFLDEKAHSNLVVPTVGTCPGCSSKLEWVELVQEMSVRTRGEREIERLMRQPKNDKAKQVNSKKALYLEAVAKNTSGEALEHFDSLESDPENDHYLSNMIDEPLLDEEWDKNLDDDDDVMSTISATSSAGTISKAGNRQLWTEPQLGLDIVIEDSEWDDAKVLD